MCRPVLRCALNVAKLQWSSRLLNFSGSQGRVQRDKKVGRINHFSTLHTISLPPKPQDIITLAVHPFPANVFSLFLWGMKSFLKHFSQSHFVFSLSLSFFLSFLCPHSVTPFLPAFLPFSSCVTLFLSLSLFLPPPLPSPHLDNVTVFRSDHFATSEALIN